MYGHYATDRGKVRSINEDAVGIFYNKADQLLAIVADGMGGHQAGEVASQLAISVAKEKWEAKDIIPTPAETEEWLQYLIEQMNHDIYHHSLENEQYEGMGTTVVLTICAQDFVTIAHVGDSRCYIYSTEEFKQVTEDHSLVNELIRSGEISKGDAEQHPRKNVLLRALGTEETTKADYKTIHWGAESRLLLCSDGLTNKVTDEELETYLRKEKELSFLPNQLINVANDRGGEDNITVAIIENSHQDEMGDISC